MPDKKLTDNEIKSNLEWLKTVGDKIGSVTIGKEFIPTVIAYINRLQAKVEKCEKVEHFADKTIATLQAENERLKYCNEVNISSIGTLHEQLKTTKAEAYKEFAERLKDSTGYYDEIIKDVVYTEEEIDNLLKEMIGE